jgi:proteasome lid subunit RPN8/RPN11
VLRLPEDLRAAMVTLALAEHPLEACGVLAGDVGAEKPARFVPLRNAAQSEVFYEVGSADLLALYQDLDAREEVVIGVFHSHTRSPAYPSQTDVALAAEPAAHYILVSTQGSQDDPPQPPNLRSFRIRQGMISEEEVKRTDEAHGGLVEER